ncbi:hypothetical protein BGY98DRAFT_37847 [Russula aff. rugulosa BPL654]|nr:hypothetical protein BGY98DRAFT_37847 [Russula aff. rugulosa BPL654]
MVIDEEFPILEYLIIWSPEKGDKALMLPETLQTPNLRHLALEGFACPMRSRLHPISASLVTLFLVINHQSAYFQPNFCTNRFHFCPSWRLSRSSFHSLIPTVTWRGNSHLRQSRHTLHFLIFVCSVSEALALTWKRLFVGSRPLGPKGCKFNSPSKSRILFHISGSL